MNGTNKVFLLTVIMLCFSFYGCSSIKPPIKRLLEDPTLITSINWDRYDKVNVRRYARAHKVSGGETIKLKYELDSIEKAEGEICGLFMVDRIYRGKGVYEIMLSKDGYRYELYSPRRGGRVQGIKIKEGEQYQLSIIPYFKEPKSKGISHQFRYVLIDDYLIWPYPLTAGQKYFTKNLDGLFLKRPLP